MAIPVIPDNLKNTSWQSSKGNVAKLAGETGVGAAMNALNSAYQSVDLLKLTPAMQYKTIADLDQAIKQSKAEMGKLSAISAAAYKLRDVAKAASDKYKKNPLIPKTAGEHALAVSKAADQYGVAVKTYDPSPAFEQARKVVTNKVNIAVTGLKSYTSKLTSGVASLKAKPNVTFAEWEKFWIETMRGLGAAIANVPETKPQSSNWLPITKDSFKGSNLSSDDIKKRVAIVEVALNKLKAAMPS